MNVISLPPLMMSALMFYFGFYYSFIYSRKKENRENLTFALTCFCVGLYAVSCAGLYNITLPEYGVEWQRCQTIILAILAVALIWFIADYTGKVNSRIRIGFSVYFIFALAVQLFVRTDLTWTSDVSIKVIWFPFEYYIIYNEMAPGILTNFHSIIGFIYFFYILTVSLKFYRSGNNQKGRPLLIAMIVLFIGLVNDTFVSAGFYDFIYMLEYSSIGMILVFMYFFTNNLLKAETELRESEFNLKLSQKIVNLGNWEWNIKENFFKMSDESFNICGIKDKNKEIFQKDLFKYINPDDKKLVLDNIQKAFETAKTVSSEFRIITEDGELKWLYADHAPIEEFDKDGKPLKMIGVMLDITRRKQAEEDLRKSESEYRSTLNNLLVGVVVHATDTCILMSNPEASNILGLTAEQLLGKESINSVWNFVDEDLVPLKVDEYPVNRVISTKKMVDYHVVGINRPDRDYITWVNVTAIPVFSNDDELEKIIVNFIDITEQKRSEEKIQAMAIFQREVLETAATWVNTLDANGNVLFWNRAAEEISGFSREDVTGNNKIWEWVYPDKEYREKLQTESNKIIQQNKRLENFETIIHCKNGEYKNILWHSNSFFDKKGNIIGSIALGVDITERKHAEKMLLESEQKYRELFDNAMIGLFRTQLSDGLFMEANQRAAEMFGYNSRDELIGRLAVADYYFEPEARSYMLTELKEKGEVKNYETRFKRKDGSVWWARFSGTLHEKEGYFEGVAAEITESKLAEEKLKRAQNYISNIIDSMPSILIGVDGDGNITQWNSEAEKSTGVAVKDAVGKPLTSVFPRISVEVNIIEEAIKSGKERITHKQARHENDEIFYEDVTIYPLTAKDVEGAVIRIDDVTEQVRMEEMMVQSEKMLSVGGLAAGMAHEINNPLAGMIQTANVMGRRLDEKIDTPANFKAAEEAGTSMRAIHKFMETRGIPEMIADINESGQRVATIVNNILSFSRKSESEISQCDLSELFDKTLELAVTDYDFKEQYDFKMIQILKEYKDNVPLVPCERAKIQQVFLNILRNGAQAMQEAGVDNPVFTVRTRFSKKQEMVCIEIEDNGPGMDEKTRKRIFEPFFTTKKVGSGTGLGLSVSYFIITENHGGEMLVESQPGSGAKFIIRLPVAG